MNLMINIYQKSVKKSENQIELTVLQVVLIWIATCILLSLCKNRFAYNLYNKYKKRQKNNTNLIIKHYKKDMASNKKAKYQTKHCIYLSCFGIIELLSCFICER